MRLTEQELTELYNRTISPKIKEQLEKEINQPEEKTEPIYNIENVPNTHSPSCFNTLLFGFWFFYFLFKILYRFVN